MRTEIKQTQISCNCCSLPLSAPLSVLYSSTQVINYLDWGDLDICPECCVLILRSLLSEKKIKESELNEAVDTFKNYNTTPRGGVVLC